MSERGDPDSAVDSLDGSFAADRTGVYFEATPEGLAIRDPIERSRDFLSTASRVDPTPVDVDRIDAPVTEAVAVETTTLTVDRETYVMVLADGDRRVATLMRGDSQTFEGDSYLLSVDGPVKLYVQVEGSVTVEVRDSVSTRISVDRGTDVVVGARSNHTKPAAAVTTTEDPSDLLRAVSTFGSALKSTGPERSWPTMRGHPPTVEIGDELSIPDGLSPPETGVRIEVPPSPGAVFVVAPLAYYLGATVEPGPTPRLVTDRGFEHPLEHEGDLETGVQRTLRRIHFLDCVVRVQGWYAFSLDEREAFLDGRDFDVTAAYEGSATDRLRQYLAVSYEAVEPYLPTLKVCGYVDPEPESVTTLPYLIDDLGVIRTTDDGERRGRSPEAATGLSGVEAFTRQSDPGTERAGRRYVTPPTAPAVNQVWLGDGVPIGANKGDPSAFRNWIDRDPVDGSIDVAVVCNGELLNDEADAYDVWTQEVTVPFDVEVHRGLSVDELRTVLTEDLELFHYVGHATPEGLECRDGRLDCRTLDAVSAEAVVLNACDSYEQGMALVENGAIGGVVTLSEIADDRASRVGVFLARLLDAGYPLQVAVDVVRDHFSRGDQYVVVGEGNLTLTQRDSAPVPLYEVRRVGGESEIRMFSYFAATLGIGSVYNHHVFESFGDRLMGNWSEWTTVEADDESFLDAGEFPIVVDGELRWNTRVSPDEL